MKIIFITGLYTSNLESTLLKERPSYIQNAPNVFQWAIVKGLVANNEKFEVLSYPFLPCFPINKSLFVQEEDIISQGNAIGKIKRYCTIPFVKQYNIAFSLKQSLKKIMEEGGEEEVVVLTYTPLSYFVQPVIELKKKYKNLSLVTIVTDLVDDVLNFASNTSCFKRFQNRIEYKAVKEAYKNIDKFILLSKPMIEKIPEAENRSIVVEGVVSKKEWIQKEVDNKIRSLFYAGTLQEFSGVRELLNAFCDIPNENYRLVICGQGTLTPEIEELAKQDSRIIYLGMQPREEVLRLQLEATVLINPRRPDNSITRFSFPSKTMEYMSSGTPMIGYKLEGIPVEYYDNYYTIDGLDGNSLSNTIKSTMALSQEELNAKARKAYDFVMKNKTAKIQVKRILDFVSNM